MIALSATAVKWTVPLPSPLGLLSSAPTISAETCKLVGLIISPNSWSSVSHEVKTNAIIINKDLKKTTKNLWMMSHSKKKI